MAEALEREFEVDVPCPFVTRARELELQNSPLHFSLLSREGAKRRKICNSAELELGEHIKHKLIMCINSHIMHRKQIIIVAY